MKNKYKNLYKKIEQFNELCGDWDFRNIDMTEPHLQGIYIEDNKIATVCEMFSVDLDDYISISADIIEDETLIKLFANLDLGNRYKVLEFISNIESHINWVEASNILYEEERILKLDINVSNNKL